MLRFVTLAAVVLLFLTDRPAHAQAPRVVPSPSNGSGSSFHWYGVPGGGLHRTFGNGVSVYPYYNFGGYRSVSVASPDPRPWTGATLTETSTSGRGRLFGRRR